MKNINPKKEGFVEISSGRIHYIEWGKGEQMHLLHANGFCSGIYTPFVQYLVDDYHITASDIRGHGDSAAVDLTKKINWEIFAEDLKEFIQKKMNPPVIGAGHSLGAVTTLICAVKYPELFKKIILIDPVILPKKFLIFISTLRLFHLQGQFPLAKKARRRKSSFTSREEIFKRYSSGYGMFKTWSTDFINAYLDCAVLVKDTETALLKCDPELEAQIFESVPSNVWKYAKKIKCPVLAIRGEKSDTFLPEAAERFKRIAQNIQLVTVQNAGHFIPMEQPEVLAEIIKKFIKEF